MEIKTRLITEGSEVNAVLIRDGNEEYPLFLKSLLNSVIFPELMKSGYKYTAIPYGFVKDGKHFEDLPISKYTVSEEEEELMYNSLGAKMSDSDLKKYITEEEARGLDTPPTNYTIYSREEFLKYLKLFEKTALDDDFMPINYFVAKEAQFTYAEYAAPENVEWRVLLEKRRIMTLKRFQNMVNTFIKMGLVPANYTVMDVMDAYYAWGIDGVNLTIVDKRRESRPYMLMANPELRNEVVNRVHGFIDGQGNYLIPPEKATNTWKSSISDPTVINSLIKNLDSNDTMLCEFKAPGRTEVVTLSTPKFNIQYNADAIVMQRRIQNGIRVINPLRLNSYIPLDIAVPSASEELSEHMLLEAMAYSVFQARRVNADVSSFRALTLSSLDPVTALKYIFVNSGMSALVYSDDESGETSGLKKEVKLDAQGLVRNEMDIMNSIQAYVNGTLDKGSAIYNAISDIVDGVQNIDEIQAGQDDDNSNDISKTYEELKAVHSIIGLSFEEMYDVIKTIDNNTRTVVFAKGDLKHTMYTYPLIGKLSGYKHDVLAYDDKNAEQSTFMIYIVRVAREVGIEECRRHIGMEFFMVNRTKKNVNKKLWELVHLYGDRIASMIQDSGVREQLFAKQWVFACSRYFEIALKGTITWPKQLGGYVEPADPEMIAFARSTLEMKIDSLAAFCMFTINDSSNTGVKFNGFCVNAQVTTNYVIPRRGYTIEEVPFYTLWTDWAKTDVYGRYVNEPVYRALLNKGAITKDFQAWEIRYMQQQFKQREIHEFNSDPTSLLYIFNKAKEEQNSYPATKQFTSVHHPSELLYRGLYESEFDFSDMPDAPEARNKIPTIKLGSVRKITSEDYKDILQPHILGADESSYLKLYSGMPAEIVMNVPNVINMIPDMPAQPMLYVHGGSQTLHTMDTGKTLDYRRLNELDHKQYGIVNLYGSIYLFRSIDGKLWEARL